MLPLSTSILASPLELVLVAGWLLVPALLACRMKRRLGVLLGTLAFWGFSIAHPILAPERYFLGGGASLALGWLPGFLYCALCYRVAQGLRKSDRLKTVEHAKQR
jgi:hypothetical protein